MASLGWASKFTLHKFWLPDSLSFLFITLAIYSILVKNDNLFLVLLMLGVLVKESVIFVAPLYYTFNTKKLIDLQLIKKCILFTLPAIGTLTAVRFAIPAMNSDPSYLSTLTISPQWHKHLQSLGILEVTCSGTPPQSGNTHIVQLFSWDIWSFGNIS